jgi:ribosomal protein L37AE/L43A
MTTRYAAWDWDTTESIPALDRTPQPCDVCDRTPARRCEHGNLLLCDDCADTDEHREYCEAVQDGGAE